MEWRLAGLAVSIAVLAANLAAQTDVRNGNNGSINRVPVYTGSATLSGSSPIALSGSYLGIGTNAPGHTLDVITTADPTQLAVENLYSKENIDSTTSNTIRYWSAEQAYTGIVLSPNKLNELDAGGTVINAGYFLTGTGNVGSLAIFNARGDTYSTSASVVDSIAAFRANPPANFSPGGTTISKYYGLFVGPLTTTGYVTQGFGIYQTGTSDENYFAGKIGIGTSSPAYPLDVAGQIHTSTGVVYPDGTTQSTAWTGVLCGGDYAEAVDASGDRKRYEPGDVLILSSGNSGEVEKSAEPYSTLVAGIYATKPGAIGRRQSLSESASELPMAMVGIVPTKVTVENGSIHKGDLLVTSSKMGYAMKGTDRDKMLGAVLGKAMGPLDSGIGVINVLVTLQ